LLGLGGYADLSFAQDAAATPRGTSSAEETCASLVGAEICQGQLAHRLGKICDGDKPSQAFALPYDDTLIATVPDVERTPAGEAFDGALDAIITAFDERGFVRDHAQLATRDGSANSEKLAKNDCPGVIVFRPSPQSFTRADARESEQTPKFVLIVGENWHSGIAMKTLNHALELVEKLRPLPRILGPYYSASADSLLGVVTPGCDRHGRSNIEGVECPVASGSMSSDSAIWRLREYGFASYRSLVASQRDRKKEVSWWRRHTLMGSVSSETAESAALNGNDGRERSRQQLMDNPRPASCSPNQPIDPLENYASLRLMGTTFGVRDNCFPFAKELVFPGNLSALRAASELKGHKEHADAADQSGERST
jgi:hypothetical protein